MKLELPYPVSANRYWRSYVPKGWTRAVVHLSDEAKKYKRDVGWIAKAVGYHQPTRRPIALHLTLVPRNGVVMDLGNCLKIAEDALQGIVYENDKQVRSIAIEYGEPDGKGALIVDVQEFIPPPPRLWADVVREQEEIRKGNFLSVRMNEPGEPYLPAGEVRE